MTKPVENADLLFRYITEVMILAQLVTNAFERLLPGEMTMAQFGVLNHLCRLGRSQAPAELARAMQVRKSTMTSTLGTLLRAGHVSIAPDETDGRAKLVSVTEAGAEARAAAIRLVQPELAAISALLPPDTLSSSFPQIQTVRKILDDRRN